MNVPIVISPPASLTYPRHREPVTFGVPLPQGLVMRDESWTLAAGDGRRTAVDVRVLDRWADGSVRWMLVDAAVDVEPGSSQTWTLNTDASPPSPVVVAIDESSGVLKIDTGAATFVLGRGGRFPFDQVEIAGAPTLAKSRGGLTVTDARGHVVEGTVDTMAVEHRGALRVSVRVSGSVHVDGGKKLDLIARVECFAGSASIRVLCTIRNPNPATHPGNYWDLGDPGSLLLKDVSLQFKTADDSAPASIRASVEPGQAWTTSTSFVLYQDSSGGEHWQSTNHINRERRVPTTFRGYRVQEDGRATSGLRATPLVILESNGRRMAAAVPEFWQNFPKAIHANQEGLVVRLFPGQFDDLHELQGGEQKTHECFFCFGQDPVTPAPLEWARSRTSASVTREWAVASGAVDFLAPLEAEHLALVDQAIDGPDTFERKREVVDQFGWRHFGEIYGDHEAIRHKGPNPLVSHYNNQYDPVAGFALQFLRTGDRRWWTAMNELAAHVIDIDIYHTKGDKSAYNGGLFWHTYHYGDADTSTHRTFPRRNTGTVSGGGPSADHNYPTGLMLRYFLTGDDASREAAIGLAQYVLDLDDGTQSMFRFLSHADTGRIIFTPPDYFGPSRSSGNSLNALVDGHRLTQDPRFLAKADELVCRVIHPDDDQKKQRLDEPEYRWFYAMFLQSLGKYLHYKAAIGQLDRAYAQGRAGLLAYARWMAQHEYPYLTKPEKLEFPTETWAAQDIRKTDIFCLAAMHASGAERETFLERAAFFHRTSIDTLTAMPTKSLARPVIVLLTSGALLSWLTRHPDTVEPPAIDRSELGSPARFVPQRRIAERRAVMILAAGVVACVSAVIAGLFWWTSGF